MIGTRKECIVKRNTISYIEIQTGSEVILFLHGWGGSAESFQELWQAMIELQKVPKRFIAIDLPGFGHSPAPQEPWDVRAYAECITQYLDALQLQSVDIVAHSFGGRVTTKLVSQFPEKVKKIVYIAPSGIQHKKKKVSTLGFIAQGTKRIFELPLLRILFPFVRKIGYSLIGAQDYYKASGVMKETLQQVIAEDLRPLLSSIEQPVKIFWGKNDTEVPISDADAMQETIKNSEVIRFDDGRHGIHRTHAKQIASHIATFI